MIGVKDRGRPPWQCQGIGMNAGVTGVCIMKIGALPTAAVRRLLVLAVLGLVTACVTQEPAFGECEEGVSDLGRMSDVTPPC